MYSTRKEYITGWTYDAGARARVMERSIAKKARTARKAQKRRKTARQGEMKERAEKRSQRPRRPPDGGKKPSLLSA